MLNTVIINNENSYPIMTLVIYFYYESFIDFRLPTGET